MQKKTFYQFNLGEDILKSIQFMNYEEPTLVQEKVIPEMLDRNDIIVKSQTGSGKTAAFGIPLCEMVAWVDKDPQALVLVPTRELAIQVQEEIFHLGRFKRLKVSAIYGKSSFYNQEKELKQKTHVIVATPGRLMDHIERGTVKLGNVQYLVIDEADEMLRMGFVEQIEEIIKVLSKDRVTVVLSATLPKDMEELCNDYLKEPIIIEVESESKAIDRISQVRYQVKEADKPMLLQDITVLENPDSCIIFCNTQNKVEEVFATLEFHDYSCDRIHGGMDQKDRIKVMNRFKAGEFRYLVTTDVAARGIDIDSISLVINYDLPLDVQNYVHRIGRTGRIDNTGKAISFEGNKQEQVLDHICKFIEREIPLGELPTEEEIERNRINFQQKNIHLPIPREEKGTVFKSEIMKLHINAGKRTKMRAVDIVGTLCNLKGVTAEDIGVISIVDVSTFVEILNNKGDLVLKLLQDTPIKGRLRKVSVSDK